MRRHLLAVLFAALLGGFFTPAYGASNQPGGQPVQGVAVNRATVNVTITIAVANTFQTVLASNLGTTTQRQALTIQNNNTNTDNCWVYLGSGTATKATSILLAPGQSYTRYWPMVPSDAIQVTCAGTDSMYLDYQ